MTSGEPSGAGHPQQGRLGRRLTAGLTGFVTKRLEHERQAFVRSFDAHAWRQASYTRQAPVLQALFARTRFWHGSGHYHYQGGGATADERSETIQDLLAQVLATGGLLPAFDPFVVQAHTQRLGESVSLARGRMYGRIYAQAHQDERSPLTLLNGQARSWLQAVLAEIVTHYPMAVARDLWARLTHPAEHRRQGQALTRWVAARKHVAPRTRFHLGDALTLGSDIAGNHAVLYGIRLDVPRVPLKQTVALVEVRTPRLIPFAVMSHVEVPLAHVEATRTSFDAYGLALPVIPLEFMERFTATLPYDQLITGV